MKKQIYLSLIVIILLSSCVSFKYAKYENSNSRLDEKLPNLTLEIDTASLNAMFNPSPPFSFSETKLNDRSKCFDQLNLYNEDDAPPGMLYVHVRSVEYSMPVVNRNI